MSAVATRVRSLRRSGTTPAGLLGTTVAMAPGLLNGHDVAVAWDADPHWPTCWDWDELEVAR